MQCGHGRAGDRAVVAKSRAGMTRVFGSEHVCRFKVSVMKRGRSGMTACKSRQPRWKTSPPASPTTSPSTGDAAGTRIRPIDSALQGLRELEQVMHGFRHAQIAERPRHAASSRFQVRHAHRHRTVGLGQPGRGMARLRSAARSAGRAEIAQDRIGHARRINSWKKRGIWRVCARPTSSAFTARRCTTDAPASGPN